MKELRERRWAGWAVGAACLGMGGCAAPYVPDVPGPSATIQVDMNNLVGDGSLNLALPREFTLPHSVLKNPAGSEAKVSTQVPAGQLLLFYYTESVGTAQCAVNARFFTAPDQSYLIFVGDTPPAAETGFMAKIFPNAHSYIGSKCYFKVFRLGRDGQLAPLSPAH